MGFVMYTRIDTSIHPNFRLALTDYKGPTVRINSLKRNCNRASAHYHGKAADFELSDALIRYLVSDEGKE
jgi:hypothetical protein